VVTNRTSGATLFKNAVGARSDSGSGVNTLRGNSRAHSRVHRESLVRWTFEPPHCNFETW
jgi:hypothetical protein